MKAKAATAPSVLIKDCTFSGTGGAEGPSVIALAQALKANAEAIKELCDCVRAPKALLHVGPIP